MMKRPEYVIAPEGVWEYLTPGKAYGVLSWINDDVFQIHDDECARITCCLRRCLHAQGDWIIPDDEPEGEKPSLQEEVITVHTQALIAHNEVLQELQKRVNALQADFDRLAASMGADLADASYDDASSAVNLLCKLAGVDVSFRHVHDVRVSLNFAGPDSAEVSDITLKVKV